MMTGVAFNAASASPENGAVLVHPPVPGSFHCTQHYTGQFEALGDALGSDCVVSRLVNIDGRIWSRTYRGNGLKNEDWYGWYQVALAPISGEVVDVYINPNGENTPGIMRPGRASSIIIRRDDGLHVLVAHVREIRVDKSHLVEAGQAIALIGNNGFSRHPHLHLGAWLGEQPLQLRFDQSKIAPETTVLREGAQD
jgi:murein DD-endopeptidase MepM/ murein hydrolase activator NlpD